MPSATAAAGRGAREVDEAIRRRKEINWAAERNSREQQRVS